MADVLSSFQMDHYNLMLSRSYGYNVGSLTGSNALFVARIGIDEALLNRDSGLLADAYQRSHKELVIKNSVRADGIRGDGAFSMLYFSLLVVVPFTFNLIGQHDGIIYNGHYGELGSTLRVE
jgi:hypothetical protein